MVRKYKPRVRLPGGALLSKKQWLARKRRTGGLARQIKSILGRNTETKFVSRIVENNVAHNSAISNADNYRVFPRVPVGNDEQSRIGDKIQVKQLTVKGTVGISRSDLIVQRNSALMVRVLILQLKAGKSYTSMPSLWTTSSYYMRLLKRNDDAGGIENVAFNGNQNELYLPVNRDDFDVLGQKFIKLNSLNAAGDSTGNSVEAAPLNAIARNFNIRVKCPKTIRYDGATQTDPSMYAPFMSVGYAYLDGSGPDAADTRVIVNSQTHMYYKDL